MIELQRIKSMDKKGLKALIERRHPKYEELKGHWKFMQSTYRGGRKWFDDNVFKYMKEGDTEHEERIKRAYRFNHSREVTDLVNKYLFRAKVTRSESLPAQVESFIKAATRSGLSMDEFSRLISRDTSINGRIAIVVDSTNSNGDVVTLKDEKEADVRVYGYIVTPEHVLDYSIDELGELNWIMIHEVGRDDANPMTSSGAEVHRYRIWTKAQSIQITEKGRGTSTHVIEVDDPVEHGIGIVPVVLADHVETDDIWESPSLINDIAYLDRAVANYLSNLDAIIQDQTFSQLAIPAQALSGDEETRDALVTMGTKRVFTYDGESSTGPHFIAPDPKQAELIITAIKQIINEIYHSVGLAGERTKQDNAAGIDNSSGVAKAYDFERVNALLTSKARQLERIELKVLRIVAEYNGIDASLVEESVSYSKTFDVRNLSNEFEIADQLNAIEAPVTMRREQMKALVEKLFPQIKEELKKKIVGEIEDWGTVESMFNSANQSSNFAEDFNSRNGADGGGKMPSEN